MKILPRISESCPIKSEFIPNASFKDENIVFRELVRVVPRSEYVHNVLNS